MSSAPPRVAFVVDHPQRDLAGLALTAFALCQAGVRCHLVPMYLQDRELFSLAPDLVVLNYFRRGNERLAAALDRTGIRFALLDTEGGVWAEAEHYSELLWKDVTLVRRAAGLCMWGPWLAEHLVDRGFCRPDQVRVTGCPRTDLYCAPWRGVLTDGQVQGPNGQGKRVLINTNFTVTNNRFAGPGENRQQLRTRYGWSEDRLARVVAAELRAREDMVSLVRALATDYPQVDLVLRPHPFENPEPYRQGLAGARVTLNLDGPVQPQIFGAAAVIQRSCSTAIEAGLAGVPAISPRWIPAPVEIPSAESVSLPVETYAEMRCALDAILAGHGVLPPAIQVAIDSVVRQWFFAVDGRAHERVSRCILDWLPDRRRVDERRCARNLYDLEEDGLQGPSRWVAELRHSIRLRPDWSLRSMRPVPGAAWGESDKHFGPQEVQPLVDRIALAQSGTAPPPAPVTAGWARETGDYVRWHHGYAVALDAGRDPAAQPGARP